MKHTNQFLVAATIVTALSLYPSATQAGNGRGSRSSFSVSAGYSSGSGGYRGGYGGYSAAYTGVGYSRAYGYGGSCGGYYGGGYYGGGWRASSSWCNWFPLGLSFSYVSTPTVSYSYVAAPLIVYSSPTVVYSSPPAVVYSTPPVQPKVIQIVSPATTTPPPPQPENQTQHQLQSISVVDVEALSKAGLNDAVIISQIRAAQTVPHLTTAQIITMKTNGVSEAVIDFMITATTP